MSEEINANRILGCRFVQAFVLMLAISYACTHWMPSPPRSLSVCQVGRSTVLHLYLFVFQSLCEYIFRVCKISVTVRWIALPTRPFAKSEPSLYICRLRKSSNDSLTHSRILAFVSWLQLAFFCSWQRLGWQIVVTNGSSIPTTLPPIEIFRIVSILSISLKGLINIVTRWKWKF